MFESIEQEYPLRVEEYCLIEDSGGAGQYRGGMGLRRVVTPVDHTCEFNGVGERFQHKPWGLAGGEPGDSGQFQIHDTDGERRLDDKPGKVHVPIETRIVIETPGAGGFGPPENRLADAVARDQLSGKFSSSYIECHYGHP